MLEAAFKGYIVFMGILFIGGFYLGWSIALDQIGPGRGGNIGIVVMSIATLAILAAITTIAVTWLKGRATPTKK